MALKRLLRSSLSAALVSGALAVPALAVPGCAKKSEAPRRTEPWPATPSASGAPSALNGAASLKFRFLPESRIRFAVAGRKGTLRGEVPLARGELELNATSVSAELAADLLGLSVDPDSLPAELAEWPPDGATVSETAREWLELGVRVPDDRRRPFTQARFHLTSLAPPHDLSPDELAKVVGGGSLKERRVDVVGTLLLHGFRAPVRAPLSARVDAPPTGGGAARLTIRSQSPLVISLSAHGVTARDAFGTPLPLVAKRLEGSLGREAKIEVELYGELVSQP